MLIVLITVLALSGCASPTPTATPVPTAAPTATPVPGPAALTVNGSVTTPLTLSLTDLRALPQMSVNASYVKNNQTLYVAGTGPSLNAILNQSGLSTSAKNLTFIASDGYTKAITLSTVTGTANATVIILGDGSLRDVIPGQAANTWVSNLTAITIS